MTESKTTPPTMRSAEEWEPIFTTNDWVYYRRTDVIRAIQTDAIASVSKGVDGWQPIETAPKDGTPILLHCGLPVPYIGLWLDGAKITEHGWYCFESRPHRTINGVKHWMPIPKFPNVDAQSTSAEHIRVLRDVLEFAMPSLENDVERLRQSLSGPSITIEQINHHEMVAGKLQEAKEALAATEGK